MTSFAYPPSALPADTHQLALITPDMSAPKTIHLGSPHGAPLISPLGMIYVYSYTPNEGEHDTPVCIRVDYHNLTDYPARLMIRVLFGHVPLPTQIHMLRGDDGISTGSGDWQLMVQTPRFNRDVMKSPIIPLSVEVMDKDHVLDSITFGTFTYWGFDNNLQDLPSPVSPRRNNKRPREDDMPLFERRVSRLPIEDRVKIDDSPPVVHPGLISHNAAQSYYDDSTPYTLDPSALSAPPQQDSDEHSPSLSQHSSEEDIGLQPTLPGQPALIRTSQLYANPTPGESPAAKAKLILKTDLNQLVIGWSEEEFNARRRLVQFWRRQDRSDLFVVARGIHPSEFVENAIVISCIFREDMDECFITSVDLLYLLEALVGTRFSVEEKNRIRRNLEGFRPVTISKTKPIHEEFFHLIMGFPNPKPRNIEKDVKVFSWKVLEKALDKIIGKYSSCSGSQLVLPAMRSEPPPSVADEIAREKAAAELYQPPHSQSSGSSHSYRLSMPLQMKTEEGVYQDDASSYGINYAEQTTVESSSSTPSEPLNGLPAEDNGIDMGFELIGSGLDSDLLHHHGHGHGQEQMQPHPSSAHTPYSGSPSSAQEPAIAGVDYYPSSDASPRSPHGDLLAPEDQEYHFGDPLVKRRVASGEHMADMVQAMMGYDGRGESSPQHDNGDFLDTLYTTGYPAPFDDNQHGYDGLAYPA
ncbi:hypothetical protein BOTBODRAFT_58318 [Botryobasidium botryosum FD-172 SS1]|uniref:DUF7082 domain-containing protein n=1 Tax=Botryobasidium botryosum (strain FD-172 SS1) TaxID=930990 RepID=A0A067M3I3_BOTB1|nr:hypothetical protein BOTBODRAFT_58318 [Botryobasidium botryosum FD-172 SS1]